MFEFNKKFLRIFLKTSYSIHIFLAFYSIQFLYSITWVDNKDLLYVLSFEEKVAINFYIIFNIVMVYLNDYLFKMPRFYQSDYDISTCNKSSKKTFTIGFLYLLVILGFCYWQIKHFSGYATMNVFANLFMMFNIIMSTPLQQ